MAKVIKPIALDETLQRVAKALEGQRVIKNVDGEGPDANGRVNLKAVKKVNGRTPDTSGNVNVEIPSDVVRRDISGNVSVIGVNDSLRGNYNTAIGTGIIITDCTGGIGAGVEAYVEHDRAFVWNGEAATVQFSNGEGTFTINPVGGVDGVFIGDTPLSKLGLGGGGSTRDFVFKSFDGIALDMALPPEGFTIPSEYTGLDTDIEFKSINKDLKVSCYYNNMEVSQYLDKIVFDMCYIPWENGMFGMKRGYYLIIHGYAFGDRMISRLIAGWDSEGRCFHGPIEIPSYNYDSGDMMDIPISIKGYDNIGGLTSDQNFAYIYEINLVKSNGVGDPNMLEIGKLNICKPVIAPDNPEVKISIPKSTNKLMSREAWLVLDLSNVGYINYMSGDPSIVDWQTFKIQWPQNVFGGISFDAVSENWSDNWQTSSDAFGEYGLGGEINLMACIQRVGIYHLVEVAPNMWIVDTKRLPKYIGLPAGFGSSSGSSSYYDSNYWSY